MLLIAMGMLILTQVPHLDALQWKSRVLIVFAPTAAEAQVEQQRQLLTGQDAAFAERDLKAFAVTEDSAEADALRERLQVKSGHFAVVLVGKDGGRKLMKTSPITPAELYGKIDAMPMRQREMQK